MAKSKSTAKIRHKKPRQIIHSKPQEMEFELIENTADDTEDHGPLPQIDRRHIPRTSYQTTAWLAPADDTGAIRRPIIRTRDLNPLGLGFRARQDVSALGEAILRLPAATGRCISVACRVRRSLELGNGWFDGLVEFLQPQPDLASRHALACQPAQANTSHKSHLRK